MKKKHYIPLVLAFLLVLVLLWPHSFPELTAGTEITLKSFEPQSSVGDTPDIYIRTSTTTTLHSRTLVQTVMERYYFRFCPLRTLFANGVLEGNDTGYRIEISGNGVFMSTGGTGYVMVDNKIYHVGFFGNGANLALMEELSAVAASEPVSIS